MSNAVVVRNVESSQCAGNETRQRAGARKNDADGIARWVGKKVQALLRDGFGLLRHARADQERAIYRAARGAAHFFLTEQCVSNLIRQ